MLKTPTKAVEGQKTIDTVKAQPAQCANPEFVDSHGLYARFGIKRTLAYNLLGTGEIKGVSLRRRGQTRGKRLFVVDSVRAYLTAAMETAGNITRN